MNNFSTSLLLDEIKYAFSNVCVWIYVDGAILLSYKSFWTNLRYECSVVYKLTYLRLIYGRRTLLLWMSLKINKVPKCTFDNWSLNYIYIYIWIFFILSAFCMCHSYSYCILVLLIYGMTHIHAAPYQHYFMIFLIYILNYFKFWN